MRVCPVCDTRTEAERCPNDDRPTVPEGKLRRTKRKDPFIGQTIEGRYCVEERLGKGGFGAVYRARHTETGGNVALKLLNTLMAGEDDAVRRFYIEAQNTHKLHHPNTVRVSDFGCTEDGILFLCMEYVKGLPLSQLLEQEGRLGVARVVRITEQILKSLAEAHSLSIVHRDIKPENVMVRDQFGEKDFVKLLDFGISRALEGTGANTQGAIGTPMFMAPEQWLGKPFDGRADLYALGCLMYQLTSGRPPFIAPTATGAAKTVALMHAHIDLTPAPLESVAPGAAPESFCKLVTSMLSKDPNGRPESAEAVYRMLQEVKREPLSDQPVGTVVAPEEQVAVTESSSRTRVADVSEPQQSVSRPGIDVPLMRHDPSATGLDSLQGAGLARPPKTHWGVYVLAACMVLGIAGTGAFLLWPSSGATEPTLDVALVDPAVTTVAEDEDDEVEDDDEDEDEDEEAEDEVAVEVEAVEPEIEAPAPTPAPIVVDLTTDPSGAKIRVLEIELDVGVSPTTWTLSDAARSKLEAGESLTLEATLAGHEPSTVQLEPSALADGGPAVALVLVEVDKPAPKPKPKAKPKAKPKPKPKPVTAKKPADKPAPKAKDPKPKSKPKPKAAEKKPADKPAPKKSDRLFPL